jgi:hypothetical protein
VPLRRFAQPGVRELVECTGACSSRPGHQPEAADESLDEFGGGNRGPYYVLTLRMFALHKEMHDHRQRRGRIQRHAFEDADNADQRLTLMGVLAKVKVRVGRPVLLNFRPPRDRRGDEAGHCLACGADTTFVFNSWTIGNGLRASWADPSVSHADTRRESMFCQSCCGSLGVRRIAEILVSLYGPPGALRWPS